jgi:hypothetical protein
MVDVDRARRLQDALTRGAQRYSFDEALHALAAVVASAVSSGPVPQEHRSKVLTTFMGNVLLALGKIDARDDPLQSSVNTRQ